MSTGIAKRAAPAMLTSAVEDVIVNGDLSKLSSEQRLAYYKARCEAADIDPRCRPFQFISLQGKLVLYATKECAEQLNGKHGISHSIIESKIDEKSGLCEVLVQASMGGRTTIDVGIVPIAGLKGADLANAKMKAMTKAKRRATLSLCGMGDVVDETELDTIANKRECTETGELKAIDNGSGYGRGTYASPDKVEKWVARAKQFLEARNQKWLDHWSNIFRGDIPKDVPAEVCRVFQLDNHLVKWGVQVGHLKQGSIAEDGLRDHQLGKLTALMFFGTKDVQRQLIDEANRYVTEQEHTLVQKVAKNHPELDEEAKGGDDEMAEDAALDEIANEQKKGGGA